MDRLHVATLNIRNLTDRWDERLPLLLADFAALQPDVIGLQEVVFVLEQDRLIGAGGAGEYRTIRGWAGRPEYGKRDARAARAFEPTEIERLDLGYDRSAQRTRLELPDSGDPPVRGDSSSSRVDGGAERDAQTATLLAWLDAASLSDAQVVVGDFNADPSEPTYSGPTPVSAQHSSEANGSEPAVTWPSGLQAPAMDTDGDPDCLDYIWLRGAAAVDECRLVFDRPSVDDPTLYPSDHFGLAARLRIG